MISTYHTKEYFINSSNLPTISNTFLSMNLTRRLNKAYKILQFYHIWTHQLWSFHSLVLSEIEFGHNIFVEFELDIIAILKLEKSQIDFVLWHVNCKVVFFCSTILDIVTSRDNFLVRTILNFSSLTFNYNISIFQLSIISSEHLLWHRTKSLKFLYQSKKMIFKTTVPARFSGHNEAYFIITLFVI